MEIRETGGVTRMDKARKSGRNGVGTRAGPDTGRINDDLIRRLVGRVTTASSERERIDVVMPFTGRTLASIPKCVPDDVGEAVRLSRAAQARWADKSINARSRIFLRFHDMLLERQDEILDLVQLENGKARMHAFEEVADVANTARYYAVHAREHLRPRKRTGAVPGLVSTWEYHLPRGVIGNIAPWNYPLTLAMSDTIPALMAGNAVVLKPDSQTPLTALWAADLLYEAGLPPGLFQIVTGEGSTLGEPLIAAVDYIQFTGSTKTGRIVARQAGEHLVDCSLELGGKNPMLVLADANLEHAAHGAVRACFSSTGQLCISMERVLVSSRVYDAFLEKFIARTRSMRLGSALDYGIDMGSITSKAQLDKVREHIEDAVSKGAEILCGGKLRPELGPLFHEPTILGGVREGMLLHDEETFGPVVSVYRFDSEEEAIAEANSTRYGLNASVWSRDLDHARAVARRIQAGSVNINDGYQAAWSSMDSPVGGIKDSGMGRRHGADGILKCTETQTVAVQQLAMPSGFPSRSSQATFAKVLTGALKVMKRVPFIR